MQSTSVQVSSRMTWMDSFRGMAMLLVVVFHSVALYKGLSGHDHVPVVDEIVGFFDPYRMPLLLLLSGLLLHRALAKPLGTYLAGKARKILWPLILWSVINFVVIGNVAGMLDPGAWIDGTYQWFLVVLMACFLVAPLTLWIPAWLMALVFVAILVAVGTREPELRQIFFFGPFFFLGAALSRWLPRIQSAPVWAAGIVGLVGIAVGFGSATDVLVVARSIPWTVILPVPGLLALIWLGSRLPRLAFFERVGRHSIVYYVVHTSVLIVLADLWRAGDWGTPWPTIIVLFIVGFGIPAFLTRHWDRFSGLFEFPATRRTALTGGLRFSSQAENG